jgi:hypothetical protein
LRCQSYSYSDLSVAPASNPAEALKWTFPDTTDADAVWVSTQDTSSIPALDWSKYTRNLPLLVVCVWVYF